MKKAIIIFQSTLGLAILLFGCLGLFVEAKKAIDGNPDDAIFISFLFIGVGTLLSWNGFKRYNKLMFAIEKESIQNRSRKTYRTANKNIDSTQNAARTLTPIVFETNKKIDNIFLSYRRSDSANVTGRIYDKLLQTYDKKQIFKDVDSIPLGVDFRKHLNEKVGECKVLIAVIGAEWIESHVPRGQKRIDDKKGFVRIEIEAALERNVPVIPVWVRGAKMPAVDELPESLVELAFRNGIPVRPDPDFHRDMERLNQGIKHHI